MWSWGKLQDMGCISCMAHRKAYIRNWYFRRRSDAFAGISRIFADQSMQQSY
jgi:hypothetical protein